MQLSLRKAPQGLEGLGMMQQTIRLKKTGLILRIVRFRIDQSCLYVQSESTGNRLFPPKRRLESLGT